MEHVAFNKEKALFINKLELNVRKKRLGHFGK
jgi:hypothetical protein